MGLASLKLEELNKEIKFGWVNRWMIEGLNRDITASSVLFEFMYLRALLCTFQISVDFYYVPVGGRGGGREGAGEGGARICVM